MPAQVWVGAGASLPGFLDLRNGHFVSDPAAADVVVVANEHAADLINSSISYSWAAHRWLPVGYEAVAPDGMHYAYIEAISYQEGRLHSVDIASGTDRVLLSGAKWGNIYYTADGIYVEKIAYGSEGNWGLWLLNPTNGALKQILPESVIGLSFGSGAAWVSHEALYQAKTVYRIDLSSGEQTLWFSKPSPALYYLGADPSGRPLVGWEQSAPATSELWVLTSPDSGRLLVSGPDRTLPLIPVLSDSHGTWIRAPFDVLWLLTSEDKLIKVVPSSVLPLGPCQ